MGVLDKFLDAIKLNDDYDDDELLDDSILEDEDDYDDDDFLDDDDDMEEKPKKKFFEKFSKKKNVEEEDDFLDDEPEEDRPIGIWGQRHLRYLKKHRRVRYANLLTSGELNAYLADIDRQAEELFLRLVKQYADAEGVTERLKASESQSWVRKMNGIRHRANEVVMQEIVYG